MKLPIMCTIRLFWKGVQLSWNVLSLTVIAILTRQKAEVGPVLISAFNSGIFSRFGCIL